MDPKECTMVRMHTRDDQPRSKQPFQYSFSDLLATMSALAILLAVVHYIGPAKLGTAVIVVLDLAAVLSLVMSIGVWISGYSKHDRW